MSDDTIPIRVCNVCQYPYPRTAEYWHKNSIRKDGFTETCKTCANLRTKLWREKYPDEAKQMSAEWRAEYVEYCREYKRKYADEHRSEINFHSAKRNALKRSFDNTLTNDQWKDCLAWWNYRCAYCYRAEKLSNDHFFPVTSPKCIGTCVENILPACRKCNSSKNDLDPYTWLVRKFGFFGTWDRLDKIETYFASIKE